MLSQLEFIKKYMENSNITKEQLSKMDLIAVPCNCGENNCKGWAMVSINNLIRHIDLYVTLKPVEEE